MVTFRCDIDKQCRSGSDAAKRSIWSGSPLFAYRECYLLTEGAIKVEKGSYYPFILSLYTARPSFEYYPQVYFVHSGLQDESLQVTISKLPYGSLTCTGGDFPCTGYIQLTSRSEGRCTNLESSLQMTLEKACSVIHRAP